MSEQEMDEKKAQKFQGRLARISRRRFVQAAALGGVTAGLFTPRADAAKFDAEAYLANLKATKSIGDQCAATMDMIKYRTINDLFRDLNFHEVLDKAPGTVKASPDFVNYIEPLRVDLKNYMDKTKLMDLFTTEPGTWHSNVKAKAFAAGAAYIGPFVADGLDRKGIADFFKGEMGGKKIIDFFATFGQKTVYELMWETQMAQLTPEQQWLLRHAKSLGILRLHTAAKLNGDVEIASLDKGMCAYPDNMGTWQCHSGTATDQCGKDPNGNLLAGSDFCP